MLSLESTLIYSEALQAANVVSAQLERNHHIIDRLVSKFAKSPPKLLVTGARGSSYHATSFARSLFELELRMLTTASTPSVQTIYNQRLGMRGSLFLTISQSGESPDLVMQAKSAKESGAFVLAIVNNTNSALSKIADEVLPIHAGPENSVAATKSFIGSLSNIVLLVSALKKDRELISAVHELPQALMNAANINWDRGVEMFSKANRGFILGRGPSLAVACEAALKMKETCGVHAEALSTAEVKHGPMTLIQEDFPVLIFSPKDEAYLSNTALVQSLAERNPKMLVVDNFAPPKYRLQAPESLHPRLDPILMIQSFYPFVSRLSLLKGFDPDNPKYLSKVTKTV